MKKLQKCTANAVLRSFLFLLLLLAITPGSNAQTKKISGKVVDALNQPLSDVSVMLKGQTTVTTTDDQGNYTIDASAGDVLVFTSIGYGSAEKQVGADATINISLTN